MQGSETSQYLSEGWAGESDGLRLCQKQYHPEDGHEVIRRVPTLHVAPDAGERTLFLQK